MTPSRHARTRPQRRFGARLLPGVLACCATLLSLPISAVTIPAVPLQSGSAYPPANVMFILDDSGSMVFEDMPGDDSSLDNIVDDKSYVHNRSTTTRPSTISPG